MFLDPDSQPSAWSFAYFLFTFHLFNALESRRYVITLDDDFIHVAQRRLHPLGMGIRLSPLRIVIRPEGRSLTRSAAFRAIEVVREDVAVVDVLDTRCGRPLIGSDCLQRPEG